MKKLFAFLCMAWIGTVSADQLTEFSIVDAKTGDKVQLVSDTTKESSFTISLGDARHFIMAVKPDGNSFSANVYKVAENQKTVDTKTEKSIQSLTGVSLLHSTQNVQQEFYVSAMPITADELASKINLAAVSSSKCNANVGGRTWAG